MPLMMRRRPLLRAAAIGGGAYYAGQRRMEAQQREDDEQARIAQLEGQHRAVAAPAPVAAPAAAQTDPIERLKELGELHANGVLTDQEFAQQKAKLLGG